MKLRSPTQYFPDILAKIRFISAPYQYYRHDFNDRVEWCPSTVIGGHCKYCNTNTIVQKRFLATVIVRDLYTVQLDQCVIMDFGTALFRLVQAFTSHRAYGDPKKFDIVIKSHPTGMMCEAQPLSPLSIHDEALAKMIDTKTLIDLTTKGFVIDCCPPITSQLFGYLDLTTPIKVSGGLTCKQCKDYYPYADTPNQPDGSFKCYGCRLAIV